MKIKQFREDFIVREISRLPLGSGPFAVYRLDKQGIDTPTAMKEILKIWGLPQRSVAHAGMKDRHAITSQYVTVYRGPKEKIEQPGFTLEPIGFSPRAITAADIAANQFEITLRGLQAEDVERLERRLSSGCVAVPNYFDDQRFGSLGESGDFVAQPWCLGNYERALFLAIAEANRHDRPRDREQKKILRDNWGDWLACKELLERSHRRSIVTYLCDHPAGFKKAVGLIRKDLRGIFVAAFQAKLWNEIVVRWLPDLLPGTTLLEHMGAGGKILFPEFTQDSSLTPEELARLSSMTLPLPSGRKTSWGDRPKQLLTEVAAEFGLEPHKLRFSYPRDVFFARGQRPLLLIPEGLSWEAGDDVRDDVRDVEVQDDAREEMLADTQVDAPESITPDASDAASDLLSPREATGLSTPPVSESDLASVVESEQTLASENVGTSAKTGFFRVSLKFELLSGQYATMLLKSLFQEQPSQTAS